MRAVSALVLGCLATSGAVAQDEMTSVPSVLMNRGPVLSAKKVVLAEYPSPLTALHGDSVVECTVWVRVDDKGKAERVAALTCPDGLHLAAVDAVRRWRWEPHVVGGRRVAAETTVTVSFEAEDDISEEIQLTSEPFPSWSFGALSISSILAIARPGRNFSLFFNSSD